MTKYCQICSKEIPANRLKKKKTTCCRSCAQKLRYQNVEERQKTALATKKVMSNEQIRAKISTTLKQDKYKESQKQRQAALSNNRDAQSKKSESLKQIWLTKDKEQHSTNIKAGQSKNNAIDKISKESKEHWQNDDYRNKVIASLKESWTDDKKKEHSDKLKQVYEDSSLCEQISKTVKLAFKNPEMRERHRTNVKRALRSIDVRKRLSSSLKRAFAERGNEILQKIYNTKKQNHSFNTSKPETEVFQLLQQVFEDIQTQYRSKVYPFNCDFYIPSLDLYIECHFHWTHGGRQFDENDKDCLEQLTQWKEKSKTSKFYQRAIKTWTDLDIRKKQIAEDNKLNLVIFYNKDTFITWFNKIDI